MRVVPRHPLQRGELDILDASPGPTATDLFRLVEADHGFGERIVVRIARAPDRRLDARLGEAFGVPDRQILREFHVSAWNAIFAPKGTPKEVVARLNDTLVRRSTIRTPASV